MHAGAGMHMWVVCAWILRVTRLVRKEKMMKTSEQKKDNNVSSSYACPLQ